MMEKAIQIDQEFAMAYRSVFVSSLNTAGEYLQKAFELSKGDRVSLRERLQIQGQYYHTYVGGRDRIKALEIYQQLLDLYPDDRLGNQFVAYIYMGWEQWEKAVKYFDVLIHQKVETYYAYYYGAMAYSHLGEYKKAQDLLELYLENYAYVDYVQLALAWVHVLQGDYEQALEEVEIAQAHDPENPRVLVEKGKILMCKGNLKEAEAIFQGLLERKDIMPNPGMKSLYDLYLLQGKFTACEEMLREAVFPVDRVYLFLRTGNLEQALVEAKQYPLTQFIPYNKETVFVEMGSLDKAQEALQALGRIIDEQFEKSRFTYLEKHHKDLSGRIELSRKNFPVAIRLLKDTNTLLSEETFLESGGVCFTPGFSKLWQEPILNRETWPLPLKPTRP